MAAAIRRQLGGPEVGHRNVTKKPTVNVSQIGLVKNLLSHKSYEKLENYYNILVI